jgi:parallel beta-helix repeat protein
MDFLDRRAFLKTLAGSAVALPLGFGPTLQTPPSPSSAAVKLNVHDFGAVGDGKTDDTLAIQSAINAAVANGGGAVYAPAGIYLVSASIEMFSHTSLYGDGMGATVLKVRDQVGVDVIGVVRTQLARSDTALANVRVSDLTLDGNRANQSSGLQFGFFAGVKADVRPPDEDIVAWRVEAHSFQGYGFDPHELTNRLFVIDCVSHDNIRDGFAVDGVISGVVRGCISYNNIRHGFNVITSSRNVILDQNIAYENSSNGFTIQNGSSDIHITGSIAHHNKGDGIFCIGVNDNFISNNQAVENDENGIRVRGCARMTISGNRIRDNSQSEHNRFSEILIDDDGAIPTVDCAIMSNHITSSGEIRARYGLRETPGEGNVLQARNAYVANRVSGAATSDFAMNGVEAIRAMNA